MATDRTSFVFDKSVDKAELETRTLELKADTRAIVDQADAFVLLAKVGEETRFIGAGNARDQLHLLQVDAAIALGRIVWALQNHDG